MITGWFRRCAQAITFNGGAGGIFLGDGTFVDADGIVLSGSIFTIGPGGDGSARAVTLAGASGRIKQYYLNGGSWVSR